MKNAFTIDFEEWFCSTPSGDNFANWSEKELRIEKNAEKILEALDRFNVEATFFVLGWVAEKVPNLVRMISDAGHEIASHGYSHVRATTLSEKEFEEDLKKAIDATAPLTKDDILGYRAPYFSITNDTLWALDILAELGFKYDSSIFPTGMHPEYGIEEFPKQIIKLENGLIEAPLSSLEIGRFSVPISGGGYFRLYPYSLTKRMIKKFIDKGGSYNFYIHPWEIDPGQPREKRNLIYYARHYQNLKKTYSKLEKLMTDFEFTSLRSIINNIYKDDEKICNDSQKKHKRQIVCAG